MKINYKRIHIGRRTIKSAIAVIIAIMIASTYGTSSETSRLIFAMLGAMSAMENSFQQSLQACKVQTVGMLLGAVMAALISGLPIPSLLQVGIGVVTIIVIYNLLGVHFSPNLPCMIIALTCLSDEVYPFAYALARLWDTAIGLMVGMLINVLILPYDNSLKIRQTFEYLEKEVIEFLEDMFDGEKDQPDTAKMRATIDDMASQLGIYSKQWLPFSVKKDQKKLEIFMQCESMARELMAQMEVLHHMKALGRLDPDIRHRLEKNGANIRDHRMIIRYEEEDIITNYHVGQILDLREQLIETIKQVVK